MRLLESFLQRGTDVNSKDNFGETCLHLAAEFNKCDIIEKLISHGADVHHVDVDGDTAIHAAAFHGKCDAIKVLLKYNFDMNATNSDGETPLDVAIRKNKHEAAKLLQGHGQNQVDAVVNAEGLISTLETDTESKEVEENVQRDFIQDLIDDLHSMDFHKVQERNADPVKQEDSTVDSTSKQEEQVEGISSEQVQVDVNVAGSSSPVSDEHGACGGSGPGSIATSMKQLGLTENNELHAVVPLPWCPHLETVSEVPLCGLDVGAPCQDCQAKGENWVCLTCYQVHCSRYVNEHMLMHGLSSEHRLVLSYADLSVWCYSCDAYIHNEILVPAKRSAHISKFDEDVPGLD